MFVMPLSLSNLNNIGKAFHSTMLLVPFPSVALKTILYDFQRNITPSTSHYPSFPWHPPSKKAHGPGLFTFNSLTIVFLLGLY
jgi:hypothetical protein